MISVIVPCYNSARYLEDCIRSILSQDVALEVLLVDDASTDGSGALADALAAQDGRVRVFHREKNGGVSRARNLALEGARGEWVTFVDADDLLPEGALRTLLAAARGGAEIVCGSHEEWDEQGKRTRFRPEGRIRGKDARRDRETVVRRLIEGDSVYNIMCNKLHSRAMLLRARIRLAQDVRIGEDALFNIRAFEAAKGFVYVDEVTYLYRVHASSAMRSATQGEFERQKPFFEALQRQLAEYGELEKYFASLVDSMALRLYKESGFTGVLRRFNRDLRPLLHLEHLQAKKCGAAGLLCGLIRSGLYPAAYVMIFPLQVLRRKSLAAWRWARGE